MDSLKHGTLKFDNGDFYDGELQHNLPNGIGLYSWSDGSTYEGQFVDGLRHGYGYWKCPSQKSYKGSYQDDRKCGFGQFIWASGATYDGNFFNNQKQGYGQMVWPNGQVYKGSWNLGKRHGQGVVYKDGAISHQGYFENDLFVKDINVYTQKTNSRTLSSSIDNTRIDEILNKTNFNKNKTSEGRKRIHSQGFRITVNRKPWIPNGITQYRNTIKDFYLA